MEDIPLTRRWVASRTSGRSAARALLRHRLRSPRLWTALCLMWLVVAAWIAITLDGVASIVVRLVSGMLAALLLAVPTLVLAFAVGHLSNVRGFRKSMPEGLELQSGFGMDALVVRRPGSEHRYDYAALTTADRVGGWVFLRQRSSRLLMLWPAELFGDEDLARIRAGGA